MQIIPVFKIILFFKIFFIFISFSHGQYLKDINDAELYIIDNKYNKAIFLYENSFKKHQFSRGIDNYNIALALTLRKEYKRAFQYIDSCVLKGYTLNYFQSSFFSPLHNTEKWKKLVLIYDSLRNIYLNKTNTEGFKILQKLVDIDQKETIKLYEHDTMQYYIDKIYYKNGLRLLQLINSDSLPDVELFDFEKLKTRSIIPWVLIRHYFGMVNRAKIYVKTEDKHYEFYNKVLKDERLFIALISLIEKGKLSSYIMRDGLEYNNPKNIFGKIGICKYIRYNGPKKLTPADLNSLEILEELWFNNNINTENISKFNEERKKIGLDSFDSEYKKSVYIQKKKGELGDDYKFWFQFSAQARVEKYYLTSDQIYFEKVNLYNEKGINIVLTIDGLTEIRNIKNINIIKYVK
ncbi:MAG: hypothetical protein KAT68_03285 [Bacteroidales bacterium]|nr:hypothetical protein [Bacteroidales bacterium]